MYVRRSNFRLIFCALPALAVCMVLSSCFQMSSLTTPPAPKYDVRSAVVVSDAGIPPALLTAVGDRVNAAILSTIPNEALPHVVLNIRITHVMKAAGFQGDRNTASVNIDASSVDSGSVIAATAFETTTFSTDATIIDDLMAEDIAARIRSTFMLTTPRLDSSS